jgi:uncharacterized integral membrane protein (TIGR00698 family)
MHYLQQHRNKIYIALVALFTLCLLLDYVPGCAALSTWVTPPVALFAGLVFALCCGSAYPMWNKVISKLLLQYSVVGTMLLGMLIGAKLLKVDRDTAYLISSGTAICGGSAIAAVGPVIRAKEQQMSVALATIFILNAIALFLFPVLGHWLDLSEQQFGTWAAIAIHDTSSVVGAGAAYGEHALEVATTIKLTRALWIIPLALVTSALRRGEGKRKITIPWFILYFIVAMLLNTYVLQSVPAVGQAISGLARKGLILTMFFIGASLSRGVLRAVGVKPLIQGVLLWVVVSLCSLAFILWGE